MEFSCKKDLPRQDEFHADCGAANSLDFSFNASLEANTVKLFSVDCKSIIQDKLSIKSDHGGSFIVGFYNR